MSLQLDPWTISCKTSVSVPLVVLAACIAAALESLGDVGDTGGEEDMVPRKGPAQDNGNDSRGGRQSRSSTRLLLLCKVSKKQIEPDVCSGTVVVRRFQLLDVWGERMRQVGCSNPTATR
jgi:hypothetical protein